MLFRQTFETPLGPMIGVSDLEKLYFLDFMGTLSFDRKLNKIIGQNKSVDDKSPP